MKQPRPPVLPPEKGPARPKAKTGSSQATANRKTAKPDRKGSKGSIEEPAVEPKIPLTFQQKILAGLALAVVAGLFIILALQPQTKPDRLDQTNALGTALASTGYTPPPTIIPGSDFGVDLVIYSIKDYVPIVPNEKITFFINNKREKSLYVSNCDGTILQRFKGTDVKDKTQTQNQDNWENIAPGGYKYCGPVVGHQSVRIPPGANADASFPFDFKQTRPYQGQDWNIPGDYRLFIQYYLLCPAGSDQIEDCTDRHITWSDSFRIVAPQYVTVTAGPGTAPLSPAASPTPTP
jgi:hypothetical protein